MSQLHAAAAAAKPFIDWAALGKVAGVSFIFGVAIVVLFSIGVVGASWWQGKAGADTDGPNSLAGVDAGAGTGRAAASKPAGAALAVACFAICAAAVLYGLWLIIPQFHK